VDAVGAQAVAREPRQQFVVLLHLGDEVPRHTLSAAGAGSGLRASDCGSDNVLARLDVTVEAEVFTLANVTTTTEHYFVDTGAVVLRRDEPDAVLEADLFGVVSVEGESAKFAGDWWCGILRDGHQVPPGDPGLGVLQHRRGHFFI
jgi:hypothetical protein